MPSLLAAVYSLDWNGSLSEAFNVLVSLSLLVALVLALRTVLKVVIDLIKHRETKTNWWWVTLFLFGWLIMIGIAVVTCVLGGGTYGASKAPNVEKRAGAWFAVSLMAIPLICLLIWFSILQEGPIKLGITPDQIHIVYRLPWRQFAIPMSHVTDVRLERHNYMTEGVMKSHFYLLTIQHDGVVTKISCNQRPWYEAQLQAAYNEIHSYVAGRV